MKPSPVPSILLFAATALLLFSLFGRGWYTADEESFKMAAGPIRNEVCFEASGDGMTCESSNLISDLGKGSMSPLRLIHLLFVLTAIAGMITGGICAIFLLNKQRSALALITLILLGVATLITLGTFFYSMSKGGKSNLPSYGFFLYILGAAASIVGSIMAMRRGGPAPGPGGYAYPPQGAQYGYGAPPGYPQGPGYPQPGYPQQGATPGYPQQGAAPGYPQQGAAPGYPPNQPPAYAPPQQAPLAQPVAAPAGAPEGAAPQQAGPGHTCGTPMMWVAQYNRWFCSRCNQYG